MAGRPPKEGIDFSGWSVNVFEDKKIERLIDGQGSAGFAIYFCLCQTGFRQKGYYLPWCDDDAPSVVRQIGGGLRSKTVLDAVNLCLREGLFHDMLYQGYGILTSRAMQRSFVPVLQKRRCKNVIAEYWLLNADESAGAVLVPKFAT